MKSMPTHIIIELRKAKDKENFESKREAAPYLNGEKLNDSEFSSQNMGAKRKWHIFQVLKEKNCKP